MDILERAPFRKGMLILKCCLILLLITCGILRFVHTD